MVDSKHPTTTYHLPTTRSPLVVIVGETASGKSALALDLAEKYNGEIICADSRTVYTGMDIGTAKPTQEDRARVPHHLLDVVEPSERFTVVDFKRLANEAIDDITARGKLPILVGGTGLYIDAVIYDYSFPVTAESAERDPVNPRHLLHPNTSAHSKLREDTLLIGLSIDRGLLKQRIEMRVDAMITTGFVDEVLRLYEHYGEVAALRAPGYKAFREYLNGHLSLDEAKAMFVRNDWRLAKRQRTWFKRNNSIQWIANTGNIDAIVTTFLNKS